MRTLSNMACSMGVVTETSVILWDMGAEREKHVSINNTPGQPSFMCGLTPKDKYEHTSWGRGGRGFIS